MEVEDESKPEVIEQPSKPKRLAKDFRMSCISGDIEAVKVYLVEHPDELVFNGDGHIYEGFRQAIVNNNLELVEFLLTIPEISANAHHRDNWPLRLAFWNNHLRVADRLLLVEGIQESITCEIIKYDLNDAAKKGHIGLFQRLLELHVSKEALLLEGYDPSGKSKLDVLRHYANQFPKLKAELDALTDEKVLRSLAQPYFLDDDEEMTNLLNGMDLLDHEELLIALEQKLKIDT